MGWLEKFLEIPWNRKVQSVPGDGFCFIQSLITGLSRDHKIPYTNESVIEIVLHKLCTNISKYVDFYMKQRSLTESQATILDVLVVDVLSFFKFQTYTQNAVDVLVHAAVDALKLMSVHVSEVWEQCTSCVGWWGEFCEECALKIPQEPKQPIWESLWYHNFGTS